MNNKFVVTPKTEKTVTLTVRLDSDLNNRIEEVARKSGRSQITIPAEIIRKLGISEGDKFDSVEKDGGIFLCPVVVYPKDKLLKIAKLIKDSESELLKQEGFDSVEDMFADIGIDIDNV